VSVTLDPQQWAEEQFGACPLGDARRTRRAVKLAGQAAAHPSGSTPQQTGGWADCKAAYRFFDTDEVTFESLSEGHWQQTRANASGHCLALGDTTELDFGILRQVEGLGPTGDGGGRGFFLHSSLLVRADNEEVIGMAGQKIFHRQPRPEGESRHDRTQRERESRIWGEVIDGVGPPPEGVRVTHIFDRGADNFEVFCKLLLQRTDWVVRAAQLHRVVGTPTGQAMPLSDYLGRLPVAGTYDLHVRAQKGRRARVAHVAVRFGRVVVKKPRHISPWAKECGITAVAMWVVEVREVKAPKNVEPLRWVLYTSHAVETFNDGWRVIEHYEKRPIIEEYHKALKTGCRMEARQYYTSARLEAVVGMLSVVAVRLLQLRSTARAEPERPAREVVPLPWIRALQQIRKRKHGDSDPEWTVRDFYRQLAGLGGFLGRKSDGEPGWITLWRGFERLALLMQFRQNSKKCG
jgi:hypothetical protein